MSCDFFAGWVGGCSGILFGHPFDTLKVRQQALNTTSVTATVREAVNSGLFSTLKRGLAFPLVSAGAINSVFFGVYGLSADLLAKEGEPLSYSQVFLAGCLGGAGQLVLACPVDLVKVRLQANTGGSIPTPTSLSYSVARRIGLADPFKCLSSIFRQEGLQGCYRGLMPQALRDIKASGLYFLIYEYSMDLASSWQGESKRGGWASFWAGGLAGVLSWQAIIYLDVVKSRVQADDPSKPLYRGTLDCVRQSYKRDGLSVFFRGFSLMSSRAFIVNGVTFVAVEQLNKMCKDKQ